MTPATERVVHHVFLWCRDAAGRDEVRRWLRLMGCGVVIQDDGTTVVTGLTGITVGLSDNLDPNTTGVQLAFALFGEWWPKVCFGLQTTINKRWAAEVAAAKSSDTARD